MKKKTIWLLLSWLMVVALALASCGPAAVEEEEAVVEEEEEVVTEEEVTPAVDEILGRAASIASVKYDLVMSAPGEETITQKGWAKGGNSRTEMTHQGQTVVTIVNMDKQVMYGYFPAQNMAMKTDLRQGPRPLMSLSATEWSIYISAYPEKEVVGTESMDGKDCLVVEVTDPSGKTMKVWVWKEYGLPIRIELPIDEGKSMTMEYKNIEFVNIPDDMFEIPPDVEIK